MAVRKFRVQNYWQMNLCPFVASLFAPRCGKMLTGSASKGRNNHYYYYHCSSSCGIRFKAENANQLFAHELKKYVPRPGMAELCTVAISNAYKLQTKDQNTERKQILAKLEEQNKRLKNAREMAADKDLDMEDFRVIKAECTKNVDKLEAKLAGLTDINKDVDKLLKQGINKLSRLDVLYENGTIKEKRDIIGSIYPEKLTFDGFQHRTTRMNTAASLIYLGSP